MNAFEEAIKASNIRSKEINGKKYTITLLPAELGLKVQEKIIKGLGPTFGVLADNAILGETIFPEDRSFFTDMSIALVKNMAELDLVTTIKILVSNSYCNSQPIDFNNHFAGNYGELYLLVEFALRENFGDFFTLLLREKGIEIHTLKQMVTEMMGQKSKEQEEKSSD